MIMGPVHSALFFCYQRPKGRAKSRHVTYILLQSFTSSSQRTYIYEQRVITRDTLNRFKFALIFLELPDPFYFQIQYLKF